VLYASMFPHLTLNLFFSIAATFALVSAVTGGARAWKGFAGEPIWEARPRRLMPALYGAMREALVHRQFSKCEQFPLSRWAHVCVFYGFLTLFTLAGIVALLIRIGVPYPFPVLHPLKIVGNLAAILLTLGTAYFLYQRRRVSANDDQSSWFDWALLLNLLLVSVTGILTEVFRYADIAKLAYPTYFAHLVSAFVLLVGLPYSKLAHVIYRTLALAARRYDQLTALDLKDLENQRVTP